MKQITIAEAIQRTVEHREVFHDEMLHIMRQIMRGELSPAQIAGFIMGLRVKKESIGEIAAAAQVMRELATPVEVKDDRHLVDTCGTGGDAAHTFNVSTCAAFVAAAAGAKVAKHMGRSVSSSSGSAEVLEALGANIALVTLRPIAGTRPRGLTPEEDAASAAELLADPKERAEHVMLIDLGRNDVGRVAATGSVKVTEKMVIERYSHVMHIVSNVEGRIAPGLDAVDVLRASFPAGTVTGAPKVRAMQIIDELEPVKRGVYSGAVGYLGFNGDMDVAIAIRTAVLKDRALHVQAAAGVVADSDPLAEWRETQHKARALLRAAELASAEEAP